MSVRNESALAENPTMRPPEHQIARESASKRRPTPKGVQQPTCRVNSTLWPRAVPLAPAVRHGPGDDERKSRLLRDNSLELLLLRAPRPELEGIEATPPADRSKAPPNALDLCS